MTDTEFDNMADKPHKWVNLTTETYYIHKQTFIDITAKHGEQLKWND